MKISAILVPIVPRLYDYLEIGLMSRRLAAASHVRDVYDHCLLSVNDVMVHVRHQVRWCVKSCCGGTEV